MWLSRTRLAINFLRLFLPVCLFIVTAARAEQLPVRNYTVANGLPHDRIQNLLRDSRGFLWFCTYDGLSRHDGSNFVNYGVKEGLPLAYTNVIIEDRNGIYWIGTNGGGVSRLDPNAKLKGETKIFTNFLVSDISASNRVGALYEDKAGNIWVGTDGGLFRFNPKDKILTFENIALGIEGVPDARVEVQDILEDREGALWIGTSAGLLRRLPDGTTFHYPIQPEQSTNYIWALREDADGRLWIGYERGLIVLKPTIAAEADKNVWKNLSKREPLRLPQNAEFSAGDAEALPLPTNTGEAVWYTAADGFTYENTRAIYQTRDGKFWVGTRGGGLFLFENQRFVNYSSAQGLNNNISTLIEDRDGNLWAGSETGGAVKIARSGFRSFSQMDGLVGDEVASIFESTTGELCVVTNKWTINRFDGKKFQAVRPNIPLEMINSSNGRWKIIEDHNGEWWVTTRGGLYRFPKINRIEELANVKPKVYTTRDGLADNNISRIYEDSRGDIWLSSYNPPLMLTRWERATNTFHRYTEANDLPLVNWGNDFIENSGYLWIGFHNGGLGRYKDGDFKIFESTINDTQGIVQGLYFDRSNRLWVATSSGGIILENPTADEPQIKPISPTDALASNNISCFIEDSKGHIYIGTARGVEELNIATGRVRHYSINDGLPNSEVLNAFRDKHGALWFGTRKGVSRLTAEPEQKAVSTPIFISLLKIANVEYPISDTGQTEIANIELGPNQNQFEIHYFGLDFSGGGNLRYQYLLEGSDNKWSEPTENPIFTANLTPGNYRFLVRAVTDTGTASEPASISFRILPPIWQRWWFLLLSAIVIAAVIYAVYRYRLQRVVEMEKVRTRIATDLHDDIGASLSQIAILSEVVRQKVESNGSDKSEIEPLKLIAGTSREMIDAMSDIVWAINPHKDNLDDLLHRMRRFASDTLEAQDIDLRFHLPAIEGKEISMGADLRREIYVIFKENINNIIKHSGCTSVNISAEYDRKNFSLTIQDNGRGFDVNKTVEGGQSGMGGNGLPNMRKRAAAMGGSLNITSEVGKGTTSHLVIPVSERKFKLVKSE